MTVILKQRINKTFLWMIMPALLVISPDGCSKAPSKPLRIGILSYVSIHAPVIEGFKEGMTELGYMEGRDVEYIYNGILENNEKIIDAEIRDLLSRDIDMLLPVGNNVALRAKKAVEGTDMPVLFSACSEVVESGLVKSITHPGGNITGIINVDATPQILERLKIIIPDLKKIYLPYNPKDEVSVISLPFLDKTASEMGIAVVLQEVHSVEEAIAAIENLPKDIDAVLRIPSPALDSRNIELSRAAIKRRIPMVARLPLDDEILMGFSSDFHELGKQTARLANQIHKGIKPSDLPIETAEFYFKINLRTAEKIGVHIPNAILVEANEIIR